MCWFTCDYCGEFTHNNDLTGKCFGCGETKFTQTKRQYDLYTDGGCWPNPGPGAYAFILEDAVTKKLLARKCGFEKKTTNNRMELSAVINGIKETPIDVSVTLTSDSQYVVKGINTWRHNWKNKKWKGVLNDDLWKILDSLVEERHVVANWVKGHADHPHNNECDLMCETTIALNTQG